MDALNVDLLLKILVAHFLSDFILQPTKWATEKNKHGFKSWHLYIHVLITAATLFIFLWNFKLWSLVLIISVLHFIIDLIKSFLQRTNILIFVTDQIFHLLIIITVWLVYTNQSDKFFDLLSSFINTSKFWWLLLAYILLTIPTSVLIGKMTKKWSKELFGSNKTKGLENAGKWIGIIERVLIFTFIIVNQLSVIGFLLAAKSVFRFGDLKDSTDQKKTEYIIIGTFISFFFAIIMGLIIQQIIK
ncbi:MAG: DUF3307 domain-containing protein [Bacteroidales bacterium]|nr:DUF3307 domain-containing protein [Bacteroidales bacterium]